MSESDKSWLDGIIGWEPQGSRIETVFPDDPAIDPDNSDLMAYYKDNWNTAHLKYHDGKKPVKVVINLPDSSQWASIQSMFYGVITSEGDVSSKSNLITKKLFELCVRFPEVEAAKPEYRDGLHRLPEKLMVGLVAKKGWIVEHIGLWIAKKYMLSDEEKKA